MSSWRFLTSSFVALLLFTLFTPSAHALPGDVDLNFDGDGKVLTDFSSAGLAVARPFAMAIQTDGKLVVAGEAFPGSHSDFILARYNANGSLDTAFGNGGKVTTDFGGDESAKGMALQADGKIVAVGKSGTVSGVAFLLARYNADGSLDTTFGTGGKVTTDFGTADGANAVALQDDGEIVVAGFANSDFALAITPTAVWTPPLAEIAKSQPILAVVTRLLPSPSNSTGRLSWPGPEIQARTSPLISPWHAIMPTAA